MSNRLLLAALEEPEDSGTTQKEDIKKTPAIMLPSILSIHCMCTIPILVMTMANSAWESSHLQLLYQYILYNTSPGSMHIPDLCFALFDLTLAVAVFVFHGICTAGP